MATNIFVNLPVKDLDKSKAFFAKLGYTFNPQFTDETADSVKTTEVLIALSCESKDDVAKIADAALAAGATEAKPPQDYGFMIVRSFNDLDGHIWEYLWMDPSHVQE